MQGQSPCPRSAERGTLLMLHKDQEGGLRGKPYQGVSPFLFFALYVCADTLGGGRWLVLPFDPISLVLAQRNGVEPPKKSAFLPRRLHQSRERYKSVDYTFLARLWGGLGACQGIVRVRRYVGWWSLACPAIRPHFFGACPKKRCRAAKEKRFLPRRLHHSRERYRVVDGTFLARLGEGAGCTRPLVGYSIMPCEIFSSSTRWTLSSMRLSVRRPSVTAASRAVRAVSMSGMPRRMSPPASRNFTQTSPLS